MVAVSKLLSIITINYNDGEGLEKTIKSVLSQTFQDFEYIVIDGNSTDNSKDVLNNYKSQLTIGISEPDTGIYNAMNKGASYASGKYLLFLNSGDCLFESTTLEKIDFSKFKDDIICGRVRNYSDTDAVIKIPPEHISLYTFTGGSLPHPSSFIKRELFNKIGGYNENYKIISDWCFYIDALIVNNCSYCTIPNIITDFKRDGISSTQGERENKDKDLFLKNRFGRITEDYLSPQNEAIENVAFWLQSSKSIGALLFKYFIRITNRTLKLRNNLSRRIGIKQAK